MKMQQGMQEAKVTPKQMLAMGLHFDMEAIDPSLRKMLEAEFKTDLSILTCSQSLLVMQVTLIMLLAEGLTIKS